MPEDYYYPITLDDDELGFFSIFDGYNEGSYDQEKKSLLLDSSDEGEDEEEGLESSDDEMDLKKKWKASTIKTTMNKYGWFCSFLCFVSELTGKIEHQGFSQDAE